MTDQQIRLMYGVDVLEGLRTLPDESVQCVVTSPPYWGLRDYGVAGQLGLEKTPEEFVAKMVDVFMEVRRVLRKDGTLWMNFGDSYCAAATGTASQKASRLEGGKLTQIEASRRPDKFSEGLKPKDLVGIPWMVAFALRADGWYLRSDIIWAKPNPMPESVTDRPTKAHEYVFLLTKADRYFYNATAIRTMWKESSVSRLEQKTFYQQEGGPKDPKDGNRSHRKVLENLKRRRTPAGWNVNHDGSNLIGRYAQKTVTAEEKLIADKQQEENGANARTVWTIPTEAFPEAHFATFPRELAKRCILAGTPTGATVLDPFSGSGTTGAVAVGLGRKYIGIDLNPQYEKMARARIGGLFFVPEDQGNRA